MRWIMDQMARVQTLGGGLVLCSLERHLIFTVPLSTQVYKWVQADTDCQPQKGLTIP